MSWQAQRERGGAQGIALLVWIARRLGRGAASFILLFPLLWFFATGRAARAAVRDYLRRVLAREPSLAEQWRQFSTFGHCALDRIFLLAGDARYQMRVQGAALVAETLSRGGALLFVAHHGSFEAMRVQGTRAAELPIAILMDRAQNAMLTAVLERVAPDFASRVIDASERGPALVLRIREALAAGQLVGMMVDRARAGEATVAVDFLGAAAHFPVSPWQLAYALKCPVILGFSIYRGAGVYDTHFELFAERLTAQRGERETAVQAAVQAYANRLAHWVREAPDNWFNFYPFWAAPKTESAP